MSKILFVILSLSILCVMTSSAFALSNSTSTDGPKDKPVKKDKPKVIIKKVNTKPRIIIKKVHDPKPLIDNLLLLDSKQLCLLASDIQCATSQSHFATSSLITTMNGKTWNISGTVKNIGKAELKNTVVTAILYDTGGAPIGGTVAAAVIPDSIKSLEDGAFNLAIQGKDAMYIVLSYS